MNIEGSLIKTGAVKRLSIMNGLFSNIIQMNANEEDNNMIELETLNLDSNEEFILSNLTATQSTISILEINSVIVSETTTSSLLLSDITYKDSVFEFHQNIIRTGSIEEEDAFDIVFSNLEISNITFTRNGHLMELQHQTYSGVYLSDSKFYDIRGGSIFLNSANLQNGETKTKLIVNNMIANNTSSSSESFFDVDEGGHLVVQNSTFTNMYSFEGGAVVRSEQSAVAIFHGCSFSNNSAMYGGVAYISDQGLIQFYDSSFTNNFAPQSGVVQLRSDGYVQFYN